jgi:5-methylcytosine-specific restriction endonuclease McrA
MQPLKPHAYPEPDTQKTLLQSISNKAWGPTVQFLQQRISMYRAAGKKLNTLVPLPKRKIPNRVTLEGLYGRRTQSVKDIKAAILDLHIQCPYCSAPVEPNEIDHYLPKVQFPEFSLHSRNLVPCCGPCNRKKLDKGVGGASRTYLNPYLDTFLKLPFYWYHIDPDPTKGYEIPVFKVVFSEQLTAKEKFLCEAHFNALEIQSRTAKALRNILRGLRLYYRNEVAKGTLTRDELRSRLRHEYQVETKTNGLNSWRAALIRSILKDVAFQDFMRSQPVPK